MTVERKIYTGTIESFQEIARWQIEVGSNPETPFKIVCGNVQGAIGQALLIAPGDIIIHLGNGMFTSQSDPLIRDGMQDLLKLIPEKFKR